MTLEILGSESSGNCYLLCSETEVLIIDAGLRLQVVKSALNHDLSKVVGCLADHVHGDHFKYAPDFAKAGIDIYTGQETIDKSGITGHRIHSITPMVPFKLGEFTVMGFPVPHGDCPNLGFLIMHPEAGKILFVTDAAHIPNKFVGLNTIMIEANYQDYLLTNDRAVGLHQSLDTALQFLRTTDLRQVRNIILLHLSSSNSDSREFVRQVQEVATRANVVVADKGLTVGLGRHPF